MTNVDLNTLVVCVDMQKDFLDSDGSLFINQPDVPAFKKRVASFLEYARSKGAQIVLTQDTHDANDAEFNLFNTHCIAGSDKHDFVEEIKPYVNNESVLKKSSFTTNELSESLVRLVDYYVTNTVFVGVCTHICVHDIVSGFFNTCNANLNYIPNITIYRSLVHDYDESMAEASLRRMERLYKANVHYQWSN